MPPPPPIMLDAERARLADLVRRLALGPSRELDAEIGVAVGHLRRVRNPSYPADWPMFSVRGGPSSQLHPAWQWSQGGPGDW